MNWINKQQSSANASLKCTKLCLAFVSACLPVHITIGNVASRAIKFKQEGGGNFLLSGTVFKPANLHQPCSSERQLLDI